MRNLSSSIRQTNARARTEPNAAEIEIGRRSGEKTYNNKQAPSRRGSTAGRRDLDQAHQQRFDRASYMPIPCRKFRFIVVILLLASVRAHPRVIGMRLCSFVKTLDSFLVHKNSFTYSIIVVGFSFATNLYPTRMIDKKCTGWAGFTSNFCRSRKI
jgi:hypothetical protein